MKHAMPQTCMHAHTSMTYINDKTYMHRYSRRELANVLEVSGDEQFRSTILMLKLFETNTRSALREIHAKLDLLAQGPRSTGAAVHASICRYILLIDICIIFIMNMCVYVYVHIYRSWAPCALCRCLCPTYPHTFIYPPISYTDVHVCINACMCRAGGGGRRGW